jgi:tellurite resistance protein TehA-like permease
MSTQIPDAVYSQYRIQAIGWCVGAGLVAVGAVFSLWVAPAQKVTYFESSAFAEDTFNTALFITFVGLAAVVGAVAAIGSHVAEAITGLQIEERRAAHAIIEHTKSS